MTQGDPAGIGPEILLRLVAAPGEMPYRPLLFAERAALEASRPPLAEQVPGSCWERLRYFGSVPSEAELERLPEGGVAVVDPVGESRRIEPGRSGPADAHGALAALEAAAASAESGVAGALVTGPLSKESIARHCVPGFVGHTEYLAQRVGLERYGRDYLMAFLAPDLQVALLSTHVPLVRALEGIRRQAIVEALACLDRHAGGRIAVPGVNPHAGEGGLLGEEDEREVAPAVAEAREAGIDVEGPESPDSLFARARRGEFDWVLALYHDQGLIAVKTVGFGTATNWTLGLPYLRTSVDHGTAFGLAGRGVADAGPLRAVVETTLRLSRGELPRRS